MKKTFYFSVSLLVCLSASLSSCTKVFRVAKPVQPHYFKQTYPASPNDIYYALRWVLRANGYPIAEEDLKNGVLKTRYVPVKARSHYLLLFGREDFGTNGAYHQLEIRLVPQEGGNTEVQVGSRIESIVANLQSAGTEEQMVLGKVADYLRSPNAQVTNLGVQ
ncbi:MAG: hypothetical protein HY877_09310 [Deltaproteobacteria bacterium]|nr:hypothetical protein [Deltaproteobacteria bacterium]